jgi:DNA repair photolyase
MIRETQAKTMLSRLKGEDDWFGLYYNMNLYRGCQHQCIYCDSRSECYQIEDFNHDVLVKVNAIDLLRRELRGKRILATIGTGSMNDPYMPLEAEVQLTRRALEVIAGYGFPVHVITKSDLVVRDLDLLEQIHARTLAAVTFTITTTDDELARKLEPVAPAPSLRLTALQAVRRRGLPAGITLMPVLPFIEDTIENIRSIVSLAAAAGASYILPAFGMTLRDRQREYYYARLDQLFPGMRKRYETAFGGSYYAPAQGADALRHELENLCREHGIPLKMPVFAPRRRVEQNDRQPRLL